MPTKIRNEFTSHGIKHHSNNFHYKSSWVKSETGWLVQAMWLQKQSSVWYAALQAQLPSFHQGEGTSAALTQAQPKKADRLCCGGHSILPAMLDKSLASWGWGKKEGFSLLLSLCLWLSCWFSGACSAASDWTREPWVQFLLKTHTAQSCIQKLDGYTEQNR